MNDPKLSFSELLQRLTKIQSELNSLPEKFGKTPSVLMQLRLENTSIRLRKGIKRTTQSIKNYGSLDPALRLVEVKGSYDIKQSRVLGDTEVSLKKDFVLLLVATKTETDDSIQKATLAKLKAKLEKQGIGTDLLRGLHISSIKELVVGNM